MSLNPQFMIAYPFPSTTLFITNPYITWTRAWVCDSSSLTTNFMNKDIGEIKGLSHVICNVSQTEKIRGWLCHVGLFNTSYWCGCFIAIWWFIRNFLYLCLPAYLSYHIQCFYQMWLARFSPYCACDYKHKTFMLNPRENQ